MSDVIELHLSIDSEGVDLVELLSVKTLLSKQMIKKIMNNGSVWATCGKHTQRVRRAKKTLSLGDELHFYYDPIVFKQVPNPAILIADEGDYSVWYKPYGMLSQGTKWGDHCTLVRWAEKHLKPQRNAFIVHRLDRAATGLIVVAHTKSAAVSLSTMFQERSYAVVRGKIEQSLTIESPVDDKAAISHITGLEYSAVFNQSLVEVNIETGRKHQIRKHLSSIGHAIVGDRLYGEAQEIGPDLQLTAVKLALVPSHIFNGL